MKDANKGQAILISGLRFWALLWVKAIVSQVSRLVWQACSGLEKSLKGFAEHLEASRTVAQVVLTEEVQAAHLRLKTEYRGA